MTKCQCEGIEMVFDEESVRQERKFYERDGADDTTLWLIEELEERGVRGLELLDIGGGLGAIQHALLASGAAQATHVDAASAYIEGAKEEARQRGLEDQIVWLHGDFVDIAPSLDQADIVTLDRVVCCYDDMPALVNASARLARRFYGLVLPRDVWWLRTGQAVINFFMHLFRNPMSFFVHPVEQVESILEEHQLTKVYERNTLMWKVAVYQRAAA